MTLIKSIADYTLHPQWSNKQGWKTTLNNFRLIIQPAILFWAIIPWLDIFPNEFGDLVVKIIFEL